MKLQKLTLVTSVMLGTLALTFTSSSGAEAMPQTKSSFSKAIPAGAFYFKVKHSGKCLDVASASKAAGASVRQYTCHGGRNQQWIVAPPASPTASYSLINVNSGLCLTVGNQVRGTGVTQQECGTKGNNQTFHLWTTTGPIQAFPLCLDVQGRSTANNARLTLWDCNRQSNQSWTRFR